MALVTESDARIVYDVLIDALLRMAEADRAIDIIGEARQQWPDDSTFLPRFAAAQAMRQKPGEAVATLEGYLDTHRSDTEALALGVRSDLRDPRSRPRREIDCGGSRSRGILGALVQRAWRVERAAHRSVGRVHPEELRSASWRILVRAAAIAAMLLGLAQPSSGQQSPFLTDEVYRALVNEISGDVAFEHVRWLTHYHRPMGGGEGFEAAVRYVEQKAREYGLEDVRVVKLPGAAPSWTPKLGELWLVEPVERRLAFTPEVALSLADYSRTADVASAELVDVGEGVADRDYQGRTLTGKVCSPRGRSRVSWRRRSGSAARWASSGSR